MTSGGVCVCVGGVINKVPPSRPFRASFSPFAFNLCVWKGSLKSDDKKKTPRLCLPS